jgi:hypothetical protein
MSYQSNYSVPYAPNKNRPQIAAYNLNPTIRRRLDIIFINNGTTKSFVQRLTNHLTDQSNSLRFI